MHSHPLDEFLSERSNYRASSCVVCGSETAALVVVTVQKAGSDGSQRFGKNSSRSKRFSMCAAHAVAMFDRTDAKGLLDA